MKTWLFLLAGLIVFSGCSTKSQNYRLRTTNAQQAALIKKQQSEIHALREKLKMQQIAKSRALKASRKQKQNKTQNNTHPTNSKVPIAPKKNIKLKKVEDSNYSSSYMYPGAKKKPVIPKKVVEAAAVTPTSATHVPTVSTPAPLDMNKAECISMIGADKFIKYTEMFGSESASLKRCKMLKAMKQ